MKDLGQSISQHSWCSAGHFTDAAMYWNSLWDVVGSLTALVYAGMQVMVPCLPPAPLSTSVLTTDAYMGNWYFAAVATWDEDDLKYVRSIDSQVLNIQREENSTLKVTESVRIGDKCQKAVYTYFAFSVTDPFLFRNDFDTTAVIWDGKLVNCSSCIIMLFVDEDGETNAILYSREEKTPDEVTEQFKSKMACLYMEDFLKAPLLNGHCKADDAP